MEGEISPSGAGHADALGQCEEPQILLVLAGLPGVGKSTFAHALNQIGGQRKWIRASQDDSRSKRRQEVEDVVRAALDRGDNVVVDRVDFDPTQRAHFVNIAMEAYHRPQIYCLVLTALEATLRVRLAARTDHPTLTSEEMAISVLGQMKRQWVAPSYEEGFDRILTLREDEQPSLWDETSVQAVLERIARQQPQSVPRRTAMPTRGYAPNAQRRGGYMERGQPRYNPVWRPQVGQGHGQQQMSNEPYHGQGYGRGQAWRGTAARGAAQQQRWNNAPNGAAHAAPNGAAHAAPAWTRPPPPRPSNAWQSAGPTHAQRDTFP